MLKIARHVEMMGSSHRRFLGFRGRIAVSCVPNDVKAGECRRTRQLTWTLTSLRMKCTLQLLVESGYFVGEERRCRVLVIVSCSDKRLVNASADGFRMRAGV